MNEDKILEAEWLAADDALREALGRFGMQNRFEDAFIEAFMDFWGVDSLEDLPIDVEQESPEFLLTVEWYLHDYRVGEAGERMIDLFAAVEGPRLPALQRKLLERWRQAYLAPYEIVALTPDVGYTVRGLLDDAMVGVDDPDTARELQLGDLMVARLLPAGALCRPSSVFRSLGPSDLPRLMATLRDAYETYEQEHAGADWGAFLREQGFLFNDYALQRQTFADCLEKGGAPEAGEEVEIADPALAQRMREWLKREYLAWIDRPTPALGGLTPRMAVAQDEGRRQVRRLVTEMISIEASYAVAGEPFFDATQLWPALGLDEKDA
jgi:hypothetical protein